MNQIMNIPVQIYILGDPWLVILAVIIVIFIMWLLLKPIKKQVERKEHWEDMDEYWSNITEKNPGRVIPMWAMGWSEPIGLEIQDLETGKIKKVYTKKYLDVQEFKARMEYENGQKTNESNTDNN